jgi:hypothetical protein
LFSSHPVAGLGASVSADWGGVPESEVAGAEVADAEVPGTEAAHADAAMRTPAKDAARDSFFFTGGCLHSGSVSSARSQAEVLPRGVTKSVMRRGYRQQLYPAGFCRINGPARSLGWQ